MISIEPNDAAVEKCVGLLNQRGSVLLVPTETVYGLVCDWSDPKARTRIYALKHRSENKPLGAFLPGIQFVARCLPGMPDAARKLAAKFCPGPLTLVVPDGSGATFGFRIPDHPFVRRLLMSYGRPLAQTSANLSGNPPALSVGQAVSTLDGEPDIAIDGGLIPAGAKASTVVLVNDDSSFSILREGLITKEQIDEVLRSV